MGQLTGAAAPGRLPALAQVGLFAGAVASLLLTTPFIGAALAGLVAYLAFRWHARTLLVATTVLLVAYAAWVALTTPV